MKNKTYLLSFFLLFFISVNAQDKTQLGAKDLERSPALDAIDTEEVVLDLPSTTIALEETSYDFGEIYQDSQNEQVIKFQNTGDVPLIITKAKGSCGCTVPYFPREPIMPGEWSEIQLNYKPGKQKSQQSKTVTLTSNSETSPDVIRIQAFVVEGDLVAEESIILIEEQNEKDRETINKVSPGCFVIYPNPTTNELKLDLKDHIGRSADVAIYNDSGSEVLQSKIEKIGSESSRLDVSDFTSGIYIIAIQIEGQKPMSQCFVIER